MKILYTTHQFYPEYGAGTELLTYMTCSQMRRRGHSVHIATGHPSEQTVKPDLAFDEYIYDNLPVHRYRSSSFHPLPDQTVMEAEHDNDIVKEWFKNLLKKIAPDLVHVFHLQRLSAGVLQICTELGIPYVITVTDFWLICPTTQLLLPNNRLCSGPQRMMANCVKHLADRASKPAVSRIVKAMPDSLIRGILHLSSWQPRLRVGPLADLNALVERPSYILRQANNAKRIFVTNRFMHNMLVDHGILSKKLKIMPFGIQPINSVPRSPQTAHDVLKVGFIGTLNHHKGAHIPIKAVRSLPPSMRIHLSLYGNRQQFPEYVRMLDHLTSDDPRIEFKGTFPSDQIGKILNAFDVLVLPSLWYENTPLILLQAQAAKLPVIATDLGGMNEIVSDGVNGFLIRPGDDQKLSSILESLVKTPELIPKLRQNRYTPMFIDQFGDLLEEEYREIVGR